MKTIKMYKQYFLLVAALLIFKIDVIAQSKSGYTIDAKVEGVKDGTKYYLRKNSNSGGTDTVHRGTFVDRKIHLTGQVVEPELYFLFIEGNKNFLPLILENKPFQIYGDFLNWPHLTVVGPEQNTEYHSMWSIFDRDLNEAKVLKDSILKYFSKLSDSLIVRKFENKRNLVMNRFFDTTIPPLIKSHPNSIYTPLMIRTHSIATIAEKRELYNQLSSFSQQSKYGRELLADLVNKEKIETSLKNNIAPDFILPMPIMGKTMSLKDFVSKSKLVYIDFWASWCVPCRAQFPELKKTFLRFKAQGFNVLGISIDKNEKAWEKAIEEDNLIWENVCDVKEMNSEVAQLYNLTFIPRSVLVDSMGRIIAQNIDGEELANKIKVYFESKSDIK
jgi:peroxiredoxin